MTVRSDGSQHHSRNGLLVQVIIPSAVVPPEGEACSGSIADGMISFYLNHLRTPGLDGDHPESKPPTGGIELVGLRCTGMCRRHACSRSTSGARSSKYWSTCGLGRWTARPMVDAFVGYGTAVVRRCLRCDRSPGRSGAGRRLSSVTPATPDVRPGQLRPTPPSSTVHHLSTITPRNRPQEMNQNPHRTNDLDPSNRQDLWIAS
jgi:hypothetical protein